MRSGWKGKRGREGEGGGGERRGVKSTAAETQKIRCQSQTQNHGRSEKTERRIQRQHLDLQPCLVLLQSPTDFSRRKQSFSSGKSDIIGR